MLSSLHQFQQAQYQCGALSDNVVGFTAELHKAVQTLGLLPPTGDEMLHLRGEDERRSVPAMENKRASRFILWRMPFPLPGLPFEASKLLRVAHDFAKVDVKHVSAVLQHDVVIVTVTDAQDEGGHTPASTGVDEVHHGLQTEGLFYMCGKSQNTKVGLVKDALAEITLS